VKLRLAGALALAGVCASAALPSHAATPSRIVFAANGAPATGGEIYRVTLGGKRVDLSNSPALDTSPAVSPDGKRVAFLSTRSGHFAYYTVGSDGRNLKRVSPLLAPYELDRLYFPSNIEWSPNGKQLAVNLIEGSTGQAFVLNAAGGGWREVSENGEIVIDAPVWSPDGRHLAYVDAKGRTVHVVSLRGGRAWQAAGIDAAWSPTGRLAVQSSARRAAVYTEAGKRLASFPAAWTAWSPNGDRLASLTTLGTLQLRAGGAGPPVYELAGLNADPLGFLDDELRWLGPNELAFFTGTRWEGFSLETHVNVNLPAALQDAFSVTTRNGLEGAAAIAAGGRWTLEVSALGRATRSLSTAAPCGGGDPFAEIGFAPSGGSLVYVSACVSPPGSLYAVNADGSGLQKLTDGTGDSSPAVSPDGGTIAFVRSPPTGCLSCGDAIWTMKADGTGQRQLTTPPTEAGEIFPSNDESPSFSPDGTQILFERDSDTASDLLTVPTAGGPTHDLGIQGVYPDWGPSQIAYDGQNGEVTAQPDGTSPQAVEVSGRPVSGLPAWSSDGRLALYGGAAGSSSIVLSTGQVINLPNLQLPPYGGGVAWSPDGTQLAFIAADPSGVSDVYTIGVDGTGLRRITQDIGATAGISWN